MKPGLSEQHSTSEWKELYRLGFKVTLNPKSSRSQVSAHHFKVPDDELQAMEAEMADEIQIMNAPRPVY